MLQPYARYYHDGDQRREVTVPTSAAWRVHCVQRRSSRRKGSHSYHCRYSKECPRQGGPLWMTWKPLTERQSVGVFRGDARGLFKRRQDIKNMINTPLVRIPCPVSIRCACTLPLNRSFVKLAPPILVAGTSSIKAI